MAKISEELAKELRGTMEKFTAFLVNKGSNCFRCTKEIDRLEQIGPAVYARPCNCRLYTGQIPEAWLR